MPLFACSECSVVDNTALGNFWNYFHEGKPPLCAKCDPEIGQWHGEFPRTTVADYEAQHGAGSVQYKGPYPKPLPRERDDFDSDEEYARYLSEVG